MDAFPLRWPAGWQRTPDHKRTSHSAFKTTFDKARRQLENELRLMGATGVVISSNIPLRQDGMPRADQGRRRIADPGVAVYFMLKNRPMSMARDAYDSPHDNLRSLGLAIEGMRAVERHGGSSMMERAFEGFVALPAPSGGQARTWRELLGFMPDAHPTLEQVNRNYRDRIRRLGPDGNPDLGFTVLDLNVAVRQARKEVSQ